MVRLYIVAAVAIAAVVFVAIEAKSPEVERMQYRACGHTVPQECLIFDIKVPA